MKGLSSIVDHLYMPLAAILLEMADSEDIQPLVCDNGTGMVKVSVFPLNCFRFHLLRSQYITNRVSHVGWFCW
jgi:hypothetical protein